MMRRLVVGVVMMAAPALVFGQDCGELAKLSTATATVSVAAVVEGGSFTPADGARAIAKLPSFCRVAVTLRPTADSDIKAEIWLPINKESGNSKGSGNSGGWNGKLMAVGSGGWGGSIGYGGMAEALRRGYATAATDDGHEGASGSFIAGHPEKFVDFAYRAEHEMTVEAKVLIAAFYGRAARYSYWDGCSGGGREGLLQAARYPDEFDGIIAGDAANIRRNSWALWLANETYKNAADVIPPAKFPMIHAAVLNACDAKDGVKDGLIEDPQSCKFNFAALACKAGDAPDCLTARQVKTATTIMGPVTTPAGRMLFPGIEPGTELRWSRVAEGPAPADLFLDEFKYVVYKDANWDWRSFDLVRDAAKAHAIDKDVDELDPHLAAFEKHGGKLLIYHGWADQQVPPGSSVEFYKSVVDLSGNAAESANWVRLFMVPGMAHCSGGEGPDTFDKIGALEQWVEKGEAPREILASHKTGGKVDRSRPLCPYPEVAKYKGSGDINDAANFSCAAK